MLKPSEKQWSDWSTPRRSLARRSAWVGKKSKYLFTLLQREGRTTSDMATALFDVVREARNMAVHDGAWVAIEVLTG